VLLAQRIQRLPAARGFGLGLVLLPVEALLGGGPGGGLGPLLQLPIGAALVLGFGMRGGDGALGFGQLTAQRLELGTELLKVAAGRALAGGKFHEGLLWDDIAATPPRSDRFERMQCSPQRPLRSIGPLRTTATRRPTS